MHDRTTHLALTEQAERRDADARKLAPSGLDQQGRYATRERPDEEDDQLDSADGDVLGVLVVCVCGLIAIIAMVSQVVEWMPALWSLR